MNPSVRNMTVYFGSFLFIQSISFISFISSLPGSSFSMSKCMCLFISFLTYILSFMSSSFAVFSSYLFDFRARVPLSPLFLNRLSILFFLSLVFFQSYWVNLYGEKSNIKKQSLGKKNQTNCSMDRTFLYILFFLSQSLCHYVCVQLCLFLCVLGCSLGHFGQYTYRHTECTFPGRCTLLLLYCSTTVVASTRREEN